MQCIDGVKGLAGVSWVVANATEYYAAAGALVYITKISKSVWGGVYVCVCVYICPVMHFAMLRRIELKLGMGVGGGPTRFVGIFLKGPHLGSKVIQGSICLRNALWLPNLVRTTPDHSIVHCWGQRSCRGQLGSGRGQFA